jgi:HK97 family phage major capsid protein
MKKQKQRMMMMLGLIGLAFLTVLTLGAILPIAGFFAVASTGTLAKLPLMAALPFMFVLRDHRPDEGGNGLADIAEKVEKGMSAVATKQQEILGNLDRCSSELKKAMEDITTLKKSANDSQANRDEFTKKLASVEALVRREVRASFGNPLKRISGDEEMRMRLNAAIRLAVDHQGDMQRIVRGGFPADFVKRALGEDASPGSTLIDDALAKEIYDLLLSYGVWSNFGVRRLGTKETKFPLKTARVVANFILTEGGEISDDTNKAGGSVTLTVEVIAALLNVSLQLLQDSEFDVTGDVMDDFAQAYAERLDYATLTASGAADATNGGMTGVFNFANAATAGAGNVTVEGTDLDDWIRVLLTVDPIVLTRPTTRWTMHPQHIVRALSVRDENGRPIFLTALEAPAAGAIGSILGYPVTPAYIAPSTNAAASKIAVFGDNQAQVVGTRTDYGFEASDHHKWNTLQRSFRGWGRAGVKLRATGAMKPFAVFTLPAA